MTKDWDHPKPLPGRALDGWRKPRAALTCQGECQGSYEVGDVNCPWCGEFSDAGRNGPLSWTKLVLIFGAAIAGLVGAIMLVVNIIGG